LQLIPDKLAVVISGVPGSMASQIIQQETINLVILFFKASRPAYARLVQW
jgi:hypothetical protein